MFQVIGGVEVITRVQLFVVVLVLLFAGVASAGDLYVVVGFKGTPDAALLKKLGATPGDAIGGQDALRATLPASVVSRLRKHADIAFVEENGIMKALKGKPANPGNGGGGGSEDPPPQETPWGISHVNAADSSDKGKDVKVAIVDSGIDLDHPDLADNIAGSIDFTGSRKGPNDENGHGSHVAGTVAGVNNTIGVIGVAPDADLYAVRVLDRRGSGRWADLADALDWCGANDIDIANMSLGGSSAPTYVKTACDNALANGCLPIAAAGNAGDGSTTTTELSFPAAYSSVVSVGAVRSNDTLASFSNTGNHVEVCAPGVGVLSTYKNAGYATLNGTSMASPHAAGIAALIWSEDLNQAVASVRDELRLRVRDLGTGGRDKAFGFGVVDYNG